MWAVIAVVAVACGAPSRCVCEVPTPPPAAVFAQPPTPQVIVFLVDKTTQYAHLESDLPDFGRRTVADVIRAGAFRPGDSVYAAWITPTSPSLGEDFLDKRTLQRIPPPDVPAAPSAPSQPGSQTKCTEYCGDTIPKFRDSLARYGKDVEALTTQWQTAQAEEQRRFLDEATQKIDAARPVVVSGYPDVRGALYGVSRVFESALSEAATAGRAAPGLKLVVFSGLIDRPGNTTAFTLKGVKVLVAAYHRHGAPYQQAGVDEWSVLLRDAGAQVAAFLPDNATSTADVAKFVGR